MQGFFSAATAGVTVTFKNPRRISVIYFCAFVDYLVFVFACVDVSCFMVFTSAMLCRLRDKDGGRVIDYIFIKVLDRAIVGARHRYSLQSVLKSLK